MNNQTNMNNETDMNNQTNFEISTIYIVKLNEFNLYDCQIIKKIIIHIETNIIGKLPEILRFFSHYNLIFNFIEQCGNTLGTDCYKLLNTEINQLETIFNVNHIKFSKIIQNND